jgi:predicted nucleic acid-binding protein
MATARGGPGRRRRSRRSPGPRYTVDASVFVNAFNPYEVGHGASLELLTVIRERGDPVMLPVLVVPEIAAAVARASNDSAAALEYVDAAVALPHVTLVTVGGAIARHAAELAAVHRLRAADALYLAVAHRYGAVLVSRDREQRTRGSAVVSCRTPEEALRDAPGR